MILLVDDDPVITRLLEVNFRLVGFRVASVARRPTFTIVRYVAERPTPVAIETLAGLALTDEQPGILLQAP